MDGGVLALDQLVGRRRDLWLVGVVVLVAFALSAGRVRYGDMPAQLAVPLAVLGTGPLVVAHRWPFAALSLVVLANGVFVAAGRLSWPLTGVLAWLLATALCPVLLPRGQALALLVAAEAAVLVAVFVPASVSATPWDATLAESLAVLAAWAAGENLRVRRVSAARQAQAQAQLRSMREYEAVVRGRAELARELHDVVAHHVSLIAVRAATARYQVGELSPAAQRAFDEIAGDARTALAQLRTVLGVWRGSGSADSPRTPQPRLADLPPMLDRMRASGMDVALVLSGTPVELPAAVELCCYRLVQEALTNAGRYAVGAAVRVGLEYRPGELAVSVRDDGSGGAGGGSGDPAGGGLGLIGMRERVSVLAGEFYAGPSGRGFVVSARIPVAPAAGTPAVTA